MAVIDDFQSDVSIKAGMNCWSGFMDTQPKPGK